MRTLGYFALFLSVLYMLACSGSNNNGGGAAAKTDTAGTFGGIQGQPIMFNGLSSDVINGRIYNRSFQIIRARGTEKFVDDTCVPRISELDPIQYTIAGLPTQQGTPNYNYGMGLRNRQRPMGVEFVFDNSGVLSVRVTNQAGQQTSQSIFPVSGQVTENTYTLDDTRQVLIIGPFRTIGTPSPEYNRYNLLQRGVGFPRYNNSLNYNQGFNSSSMEQPQMGFRSSYQAGQNPLTQNTVVPGATPQAQMNNATPAIGAMFDPMEAQIRTSGNINPQHIAQMTVERATAYYTIQIADPSVSNRNCITQTQATTERILIQ